MYKFLNDQYITVENPVIYVLMNILDIDRNWWGDKASTDEAWRLISYQALGLWSFSSDLTGDRQCKERGKIQC